MNYMLFGITRLTLFHILSNKGAEWVLRTSRFNNMVASQFYSIAVGTNDAELSRLDCILRVTFTSKATYKQCIKTVYTTLLRFPCYPWYTSISRNFTSNLLLSHPTLPLFKVFLVLFLFPFLATHVTFLDHGDIVSSSLGIY